VYADEKKIQHRKFKMRDIYAYNGF
jgi:hypothetical protein